METQEKGRLVENQANKNDGNFVLSGVGGISKMPRKKNSILSEGLGLREMKIREVRFPKIKPIGKVSLLVINSLSFLYANVRDTKRLTDRGNTRAHARARASTHGRKHTRTRGKRLKFNHLIQN